MKIKDRIKFLVGSIRCLIKGVNILYEACFCDDINDKSQELVTSRSYGRYKDYIWKIVGCMSDVSVK